MAISAKAYIGRARVWMLLNTLLFISGKGLNRWNNNGREKQMLKEHCPVNRDTLFPKNKTNHEHGDPRG